MALIPIRIDRTSKPPLGTPLRSDGHWSVQGLVGAWAFNEGAGSAVMDSVSLLAASSYGTPEWVAGGVNTTGGYYLSPKNYALNVTSGGLTLFSLLQNKADAYCATIKRTIAPESSETQYMLEDVAYYESVRKIKYTINTTEYESVSYISNASAPRSIAVVHDMKSLTASLYANAALIHTHTGVIAVPSQPEAKLKLGDRSYGDQNFPGVKICDLISSRALSPAEIASLSANPWQIYEPETVWIEVGGGDMPVNYGAALMMGM